MAGNPPDQNSKEVRSTANKMLNGDSSWIKEEGEVSVEEERVVSTASRLLVLLFSVFCPRVACGVDN